MKKLLESKFLSIVALIVVIALIVVTFVIKLPYWTLTTLFFAFMSVFCHIVSLLTKKINPYVSKKIDTFALVFIILTLIAFIAEYIILNC